MKSKLLRKKQNDIQIFALGQEKLERVEQYKYLGLTIDSQLTFQTHRDNLINNFNYKISFFKKIRKFVTTEAALII